MNSGHLVFRVFDNDFFLFICYWSTQLVQAPSEYLSLISREWTFYEINCFLCARNLNLETVSFLVIHLQGKKGIVLKCFDRKLYGLLLLKQQRMSARWIKELSESRIQWNCKTTEKIKFQSVWCYLRYTIFSLARSISHYEGIPLVFWPYLITGTDKPLQPRYNSVNQAGKNKSALKTNSTIQFIWDRHGYERTK